MAHDQVITPLLSGVSHEEAPQFLSLDLFLGLAVANFHRFILCARLEFSAKPIDPN